MSCFVHTALQSCEPLDNPDDGMVVCSVEEDGDPMEGDTCIYVCNDGFIPSGDDTVRECQSDGSWSGVAPTCERCMYVTQGINLIH